MALRPKKAQTPIDIGIPASFGFLKSSCEVGGAIHLRAPDVWAFVAFDACSATSLHPMLSAPCRTIETGVSILLQASSGCCRGFPVNCLGVKRTFQFLSNRPSWRFSHLQGLPQPTSVAWSLTLPARASRALRAFRVFHSHRVGSRYRDLPLLPFSSSCYQSDRGFSGFFHCVCVLLRLPCG